MRKPGWEQHYDVRFIADVRALNDQRRLGVEAFLKYLTTCEQGSLGCRIRRRLDEDLDEDGNDFFPTDMAHERAFVDILQEWRDAYLASDTETLKVTTRQNRVDGARAGLEELKSSGKWGIPERFSRFAVTVGKRAHDSTPSLGEVTIGWPELAEFSGHERERRALELIRGEFINLFLYYERLFIFGQRLLAGDPPDPGSDPVAWEMIRHGLQIVHAAINETGSFELSRFEYQRLPRDPELWLRAAGIDLSEIWDERRKAVCAYRSAFGPTQAGMLGALGILLCDTGWNVQPAQDLPRNPFVFSTASDAFIAERSFISSFKKRAGHHVFAFLGEPLNEARSEIATTHWKQTIADLDPNESGDGHARLSKKIKSTDISTIDIISRYSTMADSLRLLFENDAERLFGDSFWIFLNSHRTPSSLYAKFVIKHLCRPDSIFARDGFTLKGIRKTYLNLTRDATGSIDATRVAAGHASSHVLLPHYLNTPTVNAELDASIRRFQDALEGIVTRDLDQDLVAEKLGKPRGMLEHMREVARLAGITAALGLEADRSDEEGKQSPTVDTLHFSPTDARLTELYLTHLKLRHMQTHYPNVARFRQEFLPLLAWTKAIGREIFRQHLGPSYWRAARTAAAALRSREAALPFIE